ncbi:MAG: S8 family serine peptidase, partial [Lachnospiraceae bacterium]|nr:S8 family serine peptidase [Lachnospiraceae bacterium]
MTKSNFLKRLLPFLLAFLLVIPSLTAFAATDDQTTGGTGDGFTWQKVDDADIEGLTPAHEVEKNSDINTDGYVPVGEEVRVSIFLDGKSTMDAGYDIETIGYNTDAKSYRSQVLAQQKALEKKISSEVLGGAELNVVWNLTLITNIISAYVPSSKIEAIKALDGVKDVVVEIQYEAPAPVVSDEPNMSNASEMTGTQPVWSNGYTGAGSLVAIIDTGLDVEHQSFDPDAFDYAIEKTGKEVDLLEKEDIAAVLDQLNIKERIPEAGEGDLWLNSKVPFAANYVDWDLDVTHANDTEGEHGSHVAGISAANRYIKSGDTFVSALDTVYTQGNAPDAQVMVMKVFGKGGGASPTDYFAAIEDSIVLGADSVNLSLGSPYAGFTTDSAYADVFAALEESNTVMTVSAGNNGTWAEQTAYGYLYSDDVNFHTGGDPGAYRDSFTVASVDNDGFTGAYLKLGEDMIFYTETSGKNNPMVTIAGDYDYVYIDGPGVVTDDNDAITSDQFAALGARLEHVIAFCNRGTSSFFQKANAAMGQKAAACVIVNNQPGTISMDLTGYNYTNPCVSITKADGQLLKDQATSTEVIEIDGTNVTVYFGKIQVGSDIAVIDYDAENYTMSDFSSWGVPGDLTLKPEITAPGGNIYSLNGYHLDDKGNPAGGHDAYENMSGTSMAAPQMAGITAVLKQYIRENDLVAKTGMTERQLSISLLMSTAAPMIEADSESYYSVLSQGAGLVNLEAATNAKTYIFMDKSATVSAADGKVKAELGDDPERTASYSVAFTMNNMTDEDVDIELGADFFTQNVDQGFLDTWTAPLE